MSFSIIDKYCQTPPSKQNAVDIFKGLWETYFDGINTGGQIPLSHDPRIAELLSRMGGLAGKSVVELGPFEGGHSKMLHDAGASKILTLEGNSICFMKTLIIKEVLGLKNLSVEHGEIESWLGNVTESVDLMVASGVLYHFKDPLSAMINMAKTSKNVFIWTHYFDEDAMQPGDYRLSPFTKKVEDRVVGQHTARYHFRTYEGAEGKDTFCGGMDNYSVWVERKDIVNTFEALGFKVQQFQVQPDHVNGPCACFLMNKA